MTFSSEEYEDVIFPHEEPLVINPLIGKNKIRKVLVDTGSSANILFHKTYCKMNLVKFYVVQIKSLYNAIMGKPFMSTFEAVESIPHLKLKFPMEKGVDLSCCIAEPGEEVEEVELYAGYSGKMKVIEAEVEKLLKAKFIEKIEYLDWLANTVVVKKANMNWRMCVDYTDLNKACLKDHYPHPIIDQLIDAMARYQLLNFLVGYHQIAINSKDIPKTAFITT
ncbi:uncharacterized protein LOC141695470 [Apium graveolens]|uniref:uncharacterized protein LOC141695470 n=1 Tax=Apium graveolens TaxID=4045 RepID=UPI003D7AA88A